MAYRIRVLSTTSGCIPLATLQSAIEKNSLRAIITVDEGAAEKWAQLVLSHSDGTEIANIERNLVEIRSLAADELDEFADEVAACKPGNAAKWLLNYFQSVKCIYAFQLLKGTEDKNGWEILGAIKDAVWSFAPSILQADNEGFSNEDGYHILWQFTESVKGDWWMGVLQNGQWRHFQMDLGNRRHRESFLKGQIPADAQLA